MNTMQIAFMRAWMRFAAAALVAAFVVPGAPAQAAEPMREVLGPGDTVRIVAYRYPDLTTEARLTEDGRINVPLIGETKLAGMTPDEAARHIAERMRKGDFILNPQIGVSVVQARSRQVTVLGMVTRPGRYVLDGVSARLSDVIALAGGQQPLAADIVYLQRNGAGKEQALSIDLTSVMQNGDPTKNVEVRSGDSIFVPKAPVFYIYGEVERGGAYRLEPGMTVTQAIALAGGITPRGSEGRLRVRRQAPNGKWGEVGVRLLDPVEQDDVIFVRESLF